MKCQPKVIEGLVVQQYNDMVLDSKANMASREFTSMNLGTVVWWKQI